MAIYKSRHLTEDQDHYFLSFEMADVPKEKIKIEIFNNQLVLPGNPQRTIVLPSEIKTEKIEASYEDGVLLVLIPKCDGVKASQTKEGSSPGKKMLVKLN